MRRHVSCDGPLFAKIAGLETILVGGSSRALDQQRDLINNKEFVMRWLLWMKVIILTVTLSAHLALGQPVKAMPLGDSITRGDGSTNTNGYRSPLYGVLSGSGFSIDFVGSLQDGTLPDRDHEGHAGWTSAQILSALGNFLPTQNPQVVFLHIGSNDLGEGIAPAQVASNIEAIVDQIHNYNAQTETYLATLIPRKDGWNANTDVLNGLIANLVTTKQGSGYRIFLVDQNQAFKNNSNWATDYMSDAVHPNDSGYSVMGQTWFQAFTANSVYAQGSFSDDFNRASLGSNWVAHPDMNISNNELHNSATYDDWSDATGHAYVALTTALTNAASLSFAYGSSASSTSIRAIGAALMFDSPSTTGSGYMINKYTTTGRLRLWEVVNGIVQYPELTSVPYSVPTVGPGDVFRVDITTDAAGHHFYCYLNGALDGILDEPNKKQGNAGTLYSGVFIHGNYGDTNNIDNFVLRSSVDTTPPATISDLAVVSTSSSSATLAWTAPGDDGNQGTAQSYDLRYAGAPITTNAEFDAANLVNGEPSPSPAGTRESMTVSGLQPSTTYYFAIKALDAAGNASSLSNSASGTTSSLALSRLTDDFNRTSLGSNWVTDPSFQIVNGELSNTSTASNWDLAIFTARRNPVEISFQWGAGADNDGIGQGGFALMLDSPTLAANGYLIWWRTALDQVRLYTITNGDPDQPVDIRSSRLPDPVAGDTVTVVVSTDATGHHFSLYINGRLDNVLTDPNKLRGNASTLYAGVMLTGNLNNNVDNFTVGTPFGTPSSLSIVSGNGQVDTVGTRLPNPMVVRLTDEYGNPVQNANVNYTVTQGGGSLDIPPPPDNNIRIEAETGGVTAPFVIRDDAQAAGGKYIVIPSGSGTGGVAVYNFNIQAAGDYVVWGRVKAPSGVEDSFFISMDGGPDKLWDVLQTQWTNVWTWDQVSDRGSGSPTSPQYNPVIFSLTAGVHTLEVKQRDENTSLDKILITSNRSFVPSGKEEVPAYYTDAQGQASAYLTLGTTAGPNTVTASYLGLSPVTFNATAVADRATQIAKTSGDNQSGPAGQALAQPFVVTVRDQYGNPVSNFPVNFVVTSGGGTLSNAQPVNTQANGQASTVLTLGYQNATQTVEARATGLQGSPVVFTATASSGIAARLDYVSGRAQTGTVGAALAQPFKVKVADNSGTGIPNHPVTFKVVSGGGNFEGLTEKTVTTASDGIAQATLTLGTAAGDSNNVVEASATNGAGVLTGSPVTFKASAVPGPAKNLAYVSGNNQSGGAGTTLQDSLKVRVTDQFSNNKGAHPVTFRVTQGGGKVNGQMEITVNTASNGIAKVAWTLGPNPGTANEVQASSTEGGNPLTGSPVTFAASSGRVATLSRVSGSGQVGSAGKPLAQPYVVKVLDEFGNAVGGYQVTFRVKAGGGHFGAGASDTVKVATTNGQGNASVTLTLGPAYGALNSVEATTSGHAGPLTTTFESRSAKVTHLVEIAGNAQSGTVNQPLGQPFVVQVKDSLGVGAPNYEVTFQVTQGGGNLAGSASTTVQTGSDGKAQVTLTLGTTAGQANNRVEARATWSGSPLTGSPVVFTASALAAAPSTLAILSGDGQTGVVGNPLPGPFKVKVTDQYQNIIGNHPVTFEVKAGGGLLDNGQSTKTVNTDPTTGIAQATLTLGPTAGRDNNLVEAQALYQGNHLSNSPYTFKASATSSAARKLVLIGGQAQRGVVGKPLAAPFRVKPADVNDNGVPGHPVRFRVIQGGGHFGTGPADTVRVIPADDAGMAEVTLTLGTQAGVENNRVEATSTDGTNPLAGSPIVFVASAEPDIPSVTLSAVQATSPVSADGVEKSTITVTLRDGFGNAVPNKVVTLTATGTFNSLTQPGNPTDAQGKAFGYLASTKAETKIISARDVTDAIDLADTAQVVFKSLGASTMRYSRGDRQTRNVGTVLAQPFEVRVTDTNNNGVPGYAVTFRVLAGGGSLVEPQPVQTDAQGYARSTLILGPTPGINVVSAEAPGLEGSPVNFTATGVDNAAAQIVIVSGDGQQGVAGEALANPFVVQVNSADGNPVWNHPVTFEVVTGGGSIAESQPVRTNSYGQTSSRYTLGPTAGQNTVTAKGSGFQGSVTFTANGVAGAVAGLLYYSGDNQQGIVGTNLGSPLVVRVIDIHGNAVANALVDFAVEQGGGSVSPAQATTSADGQASTILTLGTTAGVNKVRATVPQLNGFYVLFTARGMAGPATAMAYHSGNEQTGTVGRELVFPLKVRVEDAYRNPVQGVVIAFAVAAGDAQLINGSVPSDSEGIATTRVVLGSQPGPVEVWAIKATLTGSPVKFTATAVTNKFPVFTGLQDWTIAENQTLEFTVQAIDDDGDPVTYGAKLPLPAGASFDSTITRRFRWTPTSTQSGTYRVTFYARDNRGGFDVETITIHVTDANRPPQITSYQPTESFLQLRRNQTISFSVSASDPDGDVLRYLWIDRTVHGDAVVSTGTSFVLNSTGTWQGNHTIIANVFDNEDTTRQVWNVAVITSVELSSFTAQPASFKGIELIWATASEVGNSGFNILRSTSRDGIYRKINTAVIPPREDGRYTYLDDDVEAGVRYYYKLEDVDINGVKTEHGPIFAEVPRPKNYQLSQNYPNPFNPETAIRFEIPEATHVTLRIFNLLGQLVRVLVDEDKPAGYHTAVWDGRNDLGERVSSGIYWYQFRAGSYVLTKKMLLSK